MATEGGILGVIRAARPEFRSPHDRVAFAVNAAFLSAGYSLTAAGSRASSPPPEGQECQEEVGIDGWNDMPGAYAFRYSGSGQEGLCKSVLVKAIPVDDMLMVDVAPLDDGSKEPLHLDIRVPDYVTSAEGRNYGQLYKNLNELVDRINSNLLTKLGAPTHSTCKITARESNEADVVEVGFTNAEEPPAKMPGFAYPPVPPIGSSDLLPGAGAGVFPSRSGPGIGPGIGGDMLVGPNDPRWGHIGVGFEGRTDFEGGRGVPPGARFDPFGPPGVPGFDPDSFTRGRRPPGRGTNPDLEHFHPF